MNMSGETVAAMSLRPGDVAHIESHACHGAEVRCGTHDIEVTGVRWADDSHDDVVIDYQPPWAFPGEDWGKAGAVAYERLARVALLWHAMDAAS